MARWAMAIDLKRCTGCQACAVACKAENLTPPGIKWARVLDYESGSYPNTKREFFPMLCMHCDDPSCVPVCPTGASIQREDGIVWVDYDKCIGCEQCRVACPYDARHLYEERVSYFAAGFTPVEELNPELIGLQKPKIGTVQKCTFCMHRINAGIEQGLKPGIDWEATPACVNACPTGARTFSDLEDHDSEVSRLVRYRYGYQFRPEMETEPCVYYLPA
jgi:phenylacetyl-CoA:acceptor oxidoreductase subunit 1